MAEQQLPPIRLASIPTRVRYNTSGCASDIRWAWRTETREELQFQDSSGVWCAVPRVTLPLDDAAEKAEHAWGALHDTRVGAKLARVAALRQLAATGETWTTAESDGEFGRFLDAQHAECSHAQLQRREPDGFSYYRTHHGRGTAVARFHATQRQVLITAFADWMDPVLRLQRLQDVFADDAH